MSQNLRPTAGAARVPILCYHSVSAEPSGPAARFAVSPRMLAAHLGHLGERGFTGMTVGGLARARREGLPLPGRPVVLTFDDGYADFHSEALPLLERAGFPATLFAVTGFVTGDRAVSAGTPPGRMLDWAQIADARDRGIEIGSHSHTHAELDRLGADALRAEVAGSRAILADRIGQDVVSFAYPYGYESRRVRRVAGDAGYAAACAVRNALSAPGEDRHRLSRMTIQWATPFESFVNLVEGRLVPAYYLYDHAAAVAWAGIRRARPLIARARAVAR
jgi:peptidoglycan/xylan/chitin deacetylase (PgdA/CDA1 family)